MRQQVNLLQPSSRRGEMNFDAVMMARLFGLVLVVLAGLTAWQRWQVHTATEALARAEAAREAAEAALAQARQAHPKPRPSQALAAQVEQLKDRLEESRKLRAALSSTALGNRDGLSSYLEALARQHLEGLWLKGVSVTSGGRLVGLEGSAAAPELVPAYLRRLSDEAAFAGRAFASLEITRPADDPLRIDFITRTDPGSAKP